MAAAAQTYPSRQITLIVPFAPGGPADVLGRLIGQKMSEDLGQQIVIDNRPGANTIIGAQAVAKAAPDGYTLLMAIDGTLVMNPFLYTQARLRSVQGFRAGLAGRAGALRARRQHQHPGELGQGTGRAGEGQARHLPDRHHHADLAGQCRAPQHDGRHQFHAWCPTAAAPRRSPASWPATFRSAWRASTSSLPLWRDKKIKILGLVSAQRLSLAPEIPTIAETFPGYDLGIWQSIVAPAGTPREIVTRLFASITKVLAHAGRAREAARRRHRARLQQVAAGVRRLHPHRRPTPAPR